jgi:hypothetical protein
MHPLVRNLYKRILLVGRDYPAGLSHVRERAKQAFADDAAGDELAIKRSVARGRRYVRDMQDAVRLHKYRAVKQRYED